MIFGIGTDICDVRRIRRSLEKHGERFAGKILSEAELAVWQTRSAQNPERGIRYLATRFAAKEAFSKAIGLGLQAPMTWRSCEISNTATGAPTIVLHAALQDWCHARHLRVHISVSDEADYATAYCVAETIA